MLISRHTQLRHTIMSHVKVVELPPKLSKRTPHHVGRSAAPPLFGSLRYPNNRTQAATKFLVVGNEEHESHVDALMTVLFGSRECDSLWKLQPPQVLISVVGGARPLSSDELPPEVRDTFFKGGSS